MPDPVMVPADLLPGLLRPGAGGIEVARGCRIPVIVVEPEFRRVWARLARGHEMRTPLLSCLYIDLATPTGWDAAVDALARYYWPDMGPQDRAVFQWVGRGKTWHLVPPRWVQERDHGLWWGDGLRGRGGGEEPLDMPPGWEPFEALRRVLHRVAGRPM